MDNLLESYLIGTNNFNMEQTMSTLLRIYEKLALSSYEKQCAISKLNLEDLAQIFQFLGTEDRKSVRLTCRNFKNSLDNLVGIHVNLDQRKIDTMDEFSLPPSGASSIRLWSITNSKFLDFVLRRPNLIRAACFGGQISLSAFTKILSRCMNLQTLSFTDRSHLYANIVPLSMEHLHTLDIGCPGYSNDYVVQDAVVPTLWLTNEMLLRRLIAPNLKVLRIFYCCVEECSVLHHAIAQIFRFLAVHDKVNELSINLHHRYERFNFLEGDVNYRCFRIDVPKKILRRLRLQKLQVETMEPAFKVWDSILPAQKHLNEIDIMNRGRRWFYFAKIISNNYDTLKVCRLHNISPKRTKTPVLDAGVFANCRVLETLFLSRFENSTQEIVYCYPNENSEFPFLDTETSSKPEMENLTKLPVTLKRLHIQGLVQNSQELCSGISRLKNLRLLELQLTGYHIPPFSEDGNERVDDERNTQKNLGVTAEVIRTAINNCRQLETFFIEEFENAWTKVRGTLLGDKLSKISHIAGDGYFREGEYYGILICSSIPQNSIGLTRSERMHLWGVRVSQYCHQQKSKNKDRRKRKNKYEFERDGGKDLRELEELVDNDKSEDEDCSDDQLNYCREYALGEPVSSTSLLEILDKENGQLEQIQRLLKAGQTPPPVTPTKLQTERTQKIANEYSNTLFSAIPNYHKASRLQLDPTEKFASFFPRSKCYSHAYRHAALLKKMRNSQKLIQKL